MHTGHIVLVEADSAEEAKSIVEGNLMPEEGSSWADWSDWCELGGRWADEFEGEEDHAVLCYDENPLLAEAKISKFLEFRMNFIAESIAEIEEKGFDIVTALKMYNPEGNGTPAIFPDWLSLWKVRSALEVVDGVWTPKSFVYDMSYGSTSLEEFRKRCDSAPEKQFLVMVDFHY